MIVLDSQITVSPSTRVGTRPFGFIFRYSGVSFFPNGPPQSSRSTLAPSSDTAQSTLRTFSEPARPNNFIFISLFFRSLDRERQYFSSANNPFAIVLTELEDLQWKFCQTDFLARSDIPLPKMQRTSQERPIDGAFSERRILMRAIGADRVDFSFCSDQQNDLSSWQRDFPPLPVLHIFERPQGQPGFSRIGHNESLLG